MFPSGRFAFTLSRVARNLDILELDPVSGAIVERESAIYLLERDPATFTSHPFGQHVYVAFSNPLEIQRYTIFGDASVEVGPTYPLPFEPSSVRIHPSGGYAFVTSAVDGRVARFSVEASDGDLVPLGTTTVPGAPERIEFGPAGIHAYLLDSQENRVTRYLVDLADGTLQFPTSVRTRRGPLSLGFLQTNEPKIPAIRNLYALNDGSADVQSFTVDPVTGAATEVGLPTQVGNEPADLALDPRARFAYVSSPSDQEIRIFGMAPGTGELSEIAPPVDLPGFPRGLAVDPSARFLLCALDGPNNLYSFAIDPVTGELTQVHQVLTAEGPTGVSFDPTGRFVYVSCADAEQIDAFEITDGFLLGGPYSVPASSLPDTLTFSRDGDRALCSLTGSHEVATFDISPLDGSLTPIGTPITGIGREPRALTLHPDQSWAYVAMGGASGDPGSVRQLSYLNQTGQLVANSEVVDGLQPFDLVIDPRGRFLYALNRAGDNLTVFALDPLSGEPAPTSTHPLGVAPRSLEIFEIVQ